MSKNIFLYGLSGSGKDTIANYLRDNHDFLKLRIAKTIKDIIFEAGGFSTQEEFEKVKRQNVKVRKSHHLIGELLDFVSHMFETLQVTDTEMVGDESSLNRLKSLISRESLDYEIVKGSNQKDRVICDVRTYIEVYVLLRSGWTGIFLKRNVNEYISSHRTEQSLFDEKVLWLNLTSQFPTQIIVIENQDYTEQQLIEEIKQIISNNN